MSFNNHDADDPNGKKFGHRNKVVSSLVHDIDDDSEDFELMQVYLMAKAMKYSQWKEWLNKTHPNKVSLSDDDVKHVENQFKKLF